MRRFGEYFGQIHKRHVVTSRVEHPAVYNLCKYLAQSGYHVTELGVDSNGMLNLNELADAIKEDTAIVSIMYANNETGVIFPHRGDWRYCETKRFYFAY